MGFGSIVGLGGRGFVNLILIVWEGRSFKIVCGFEEFGFGIGF